MRKSSQIGEEKVKFEQKKIVAIGEDKKAPEFFLVVVRGRFISLSLHC